jgi:tetrahydromethanopterin S-methyltransferase subunit G
METMVREAWTDDRLDDLNKKVDQGFAKVDRRFESLEGRMDTRFNSLEERLDARFGRIDERFEALNRTLIGSAAVIVAALLGIIATQL